MAPLRRPTSFLDLPGELRNLIYEDVLLDDHAILLQHNAPWIRDPTMSVACPCIWRECMSVYVAVNNFQSPFWGDIARFLLYLKRERLPKPKTIRIAIPMNYAKVHSVARHFRDLGLDMESVVVQQSGFINPEWIPLADLRMDCLEYRGTSEWRLQQ